MSSKTNKYLIKIFVTKVYKVILDRDPDDDGKNYWVGEVKNVT